MATPRSALSFTTAIPLTSRCPSLNSSSSAHSEGCLEVIISRSWLSWSSCSHIFEFVVKNCSKPLLTRNASDFTTGLSAKWSGASYSFAGSTSFLDSEGDSWIKKSQTNSSDKCHNQGPNFLLEASEIAAFECLRRFIISQRSLRGVSKASGAAIHVQMWIRIENVANSPIPLCSTVVILNWPRNKNILTLVIQRARCMVPVIWNWIPQAGTPPRNITDS